MTRLAIALILFLAALEGGIAAWRHAITPSTAPTFSYPPAAAEFGKSAALAPALAVFRADRAAECKLSGPDHTHLTVLYFEWDRFDLSPVMNLALHAPEVCNATIGYKLQEVLPFRTYQTAGHEPLDFDSTHFKDPTGQDVFIFKVVWLQGYGCLRMREDGPGAPPLAEGEHRFDRIKNSFVRHRGAARILETAVFGARDNNHAWQLFTTQILDHLAWR